MDRLPPASAPLPRQTAGWCLVLFYLCVSSPLSVPIMLALGALGQGHQVLLGMGREGVPLVVLHHARFGPEHQHGILTRTLTVFAKTNVTANADHILELAAPVQCLQTENSKFSGLAVTAMAVATALGRDALRANPSAALMAPSLRDERGLLHFLRSSQLLI